MTIVAIEEEVVSEEVECTEEDLDCDVTKIEEVEECEEDDLECKEAKAEEELIFDGWKAPKKREKEEEEPEVLELFFSSASNTGEAKFEFSHLVVSHSNFTVVQQAFELEFYKFDDEYILDQATIASWQISRIEESVLNIQLNFAAPIEVSQGHKKDKVNLYLTKPPIFSLEGS